MSASDEPILDPKFLNIDPLRKSYTERVVETVDRIESLRERNTALLCIDMQYLDAARGHGVFHESEIPGVPPEAQEYYFSTLETVVLPNVRRLQDAFRTRGLEVIHVRICALTQDGRDRSPGHRRLQLLARPGSKEAEFLEQIAPEGDEIVIDKTASGVFNSTNIEYVLRNLEIDSLFVTGVYTDECVSTTVRDASDRGFLVTLIDDGCATVTPDRHDFTIATLKDRYTRVLNTRHRLTGPRPGGSAPARGALRVGDSAPPVVSREGAGVRRKRAAPGAALPGRDRPAIRSSRWSPRS